MNSHFQEIERLKRQIIEKYSPEAIILFGSCAKGRIRKNSDIDLCVIIETDNKRELVQEMLLTLDYNKDLDIVIFRPSEWERDKDNLATFAGLINRTGVKIYG
ncbi:MULTISPECIES: nucleotidyltransferase domain-containing protein [Carboxydocella]|nr:MULTISPECIES: nucleotidyltransferase domain-containing protein [Carboxydocella]GAW31297.1 nucleotidyltransferase [Carboxydocella sp. JDF658]